MSAEAAWAVTEDAVRFVETIWRLAEERSLEHLRRTAEKAGLTPGEANTSHGEYLGEILESTKYHALQSVGGREAIIHLVFGRAGEALTSTTRGQVLRVKYQAGIPDVSFGPAEPSTPTAPRHRMKP